MTMEMLLLSVCLYKSKDATPIPSREEIWADRTDRRLNWLISTSVLPIYRRLPFFITCSSSAAVAAGIQISTKSGFVPNMWLCFSSSGFIHGIQDDESMAGTKYNSWIAGLNYMLRCGDEMRGDLRPWLWHWNHVQSVFIYGRPSKKGENYHKHRIDLVIYYGPRMNHRIDNWFPILPTKQQLLGSSKERKRWRERNRLASNLRRHTLHCNFLITSIPEPNRFLWRQQIAN